MTHEHNIVFWIEDSSLTENFGDPIGNGVVFLTPGRDMWATEIHQALPRLLSHPDTKGLTITRMGLYRHYDSAAFPGVTGSVHVIEVSFGNAPVWETFFETVQTVVYDGVGASGQFTRGRMASRTMEMRTIEVVRTHVDVLEVERNEQQAESILDRARHIARNRYMETLGPDSITVEPVLLVEV